VLDQACAVTAAWNARRSAPLGVSVNLSARQLTDPHLLDTVRGALASSGLPAQLLCLEVTETVVMEDPVASGLVLAQLRELGVRIAVDDFGTGYSSLAYLLSLPVDVLKVDRSFVSAVGEGGPGAAIVSAVLALARTLGLGVVAEGVERAEQRHVLLGLGVVSAQGWLWGQAVPAADAGWAALDGPLPQLGNGIPRARRGGAIELDQRPAEELVAERRPPS
jgi:EAL domain-containing protein (putative c-di-GMP-specific phosphodiesterase class I)